MQIKTFYLETGFGPIRNSDILKQAEERQYLHFHDTQTSRVYFLKAKHAIKVGKLLGLDMAFNPQVKRLSFLQPKEVAFD